MVFRLGLLLKIRFLALSMVSWSGILLKRLVTFKWLNEYNLNKPKFYLQYVGDTLAAFNNEQDSLIFLNFLNNRHPNIKFAIEKQINNQSITFLDGFISGINDQNLTLQTYHNSTYTGLLLNFQGFTSFSYSISLIKCLIDR